MAQHPVKNTWKFISCEHGIAESAKLKRGEIWEGEWHGACLGREGGGVHKLGGGGSQELSGLIPGASCAQLSAVLLGLRGESHAPQCGRVVITVEEVNAIQERVNKFLFKILNNKFSTIKYKLTCDSFSFLGTKNIPLYQNVALEAPTLNPDIFSDSTNI